MNILKWNKEFALEQAADDEELLTELLDIFKDSFQSDLLLIEQGLAEASTTKVSSAAHSIKGAAASLGILAINETAKRVEEDSRDGGLEVARENIGLLKSFLAELKNL